jgi:hypothetical protein
MLNTMETFPEYDSTLIHGSHYDKSALYQPVDSKHTVSVGGQIILDLILPSAGKIWQNHFRLFFEFSVIWGSGKN